MRLAVYTDYAYHRVDGAIFAERAFALFLARLGRELERLVVIGRLDPSPARARYRLPAEVEFVPLPFYPRLSEPLPALRGMARSVGAFCRALGTVDAVWLLGPHPLIFVFAAAAALRRKRVVLGVRQSFPEYVRSRHPNRPLAHIAADLLEHGFRLLGRFCDVVAVGPDIAHGYRRSRRLLQISVSLIEQAELVDPATASERSYADRLNVLSVGRLDPEKNPLLLADVLAELKRTDPRWRMTICGEGALREALAQRLDQLGVADSADLRGYVPLDDGLRQLYRDSHVLLHVSWTEGLPQVLFEAFAAALPVVATDVGSVGAIADGAITLVPPGDAGSAAQALVEIAADPQLRERMIASGHRLAASATIESETRRVYEFILEGAGESGR